MYIRRKVFSLLQDENGEERYFSTTEFTDERLYAEKEDDEKSGKGKKAAIIAGTAAAPVALAGGYQLVRKGQKKYDDKKSLKANAGDGSQRAYKAAKRKAERNESDIVKAEEAINKGVKNAAKWVKETWKGENTEAAKKAAEYEKAMKSKNLRGAAKTTAEETLAKYQKKAKNAGIRNKALMIGGTAATVAAPIAATKLAKKNKKQNKD